MAGPVGGTRPPRREGRRERRPDAGRGTAGSDRPDLPAAGRPRGHLRGPPGSVGVAAGRDPRPGLYAVKPDGSGLRPIVAPTNCSCWGPQSSPDGTQIAYSAWADYDTGSLLRAFIVASDGQANRIVKPIPDGDLNSAGEWSNDGRRLFVNGCHYDPANPDCVDTSVLVHVDGSGADVRIDTGAGAAGADGTTQRWSPDDGIIVTTLLGPEGRPMSEASSLWDPMTGRSRPAPWTGGEDPSWQRLAP